MKQLMPNGSHRITDYNTYLRFCQYFIRDYKNVNIAFQRFFPYNDFA